MIFSAVRDWKTTIHCVVWILSVFFGLFILLMPIEARDYHIRASDGEVYTITLGEVPDIYNFSVQKSNGEILRGVTEAERTTATELYFAAKLFWHILPLYSLDTPVEDLDVWVTDIAKGAIIKLLVQQGADIVLDGAVNGFLGTVQLLLGGNPVEIVDGWIPGALNDAVERDAEQRLLVDAANLAKSFAATAVAYENMLRDFYLSYETRSVIISIDEINTAWGSFYIVAECKSLTTNLIHRYLQDPESEISLELGSLGSIAVSLLPAGKTTTTIAERVVTTTDLIGDVTDAIETIDSVNYAQEHIEKLQHVRENAGLWIYQQVLSDINEKKRELRGTLDQVGYFQPTIAAPLEDIRLFDNDPWPLDVRDYFSPNSGESLTYIGRSNDLSVAVAREEKPGSSVIIITPKGVGTTSVRVELINLRGLRVEQSFSVTVNVPEADEPPPVPFPPQESDPPVSAEDEPSAEQPSSQRYPDLSITNISVDPQDPMPPGERFTVSVSVENIGERRATHTTLRYYLSDDSTYSRDDKEFEDQSERLPTFDVGATEDARVHLEVPDTPPGDYYIIARLEQFRNERNTDNNAKAVKITVTSPPAPDLVVSLTSNKSLVDLDENFRLDAIVRNQGEESARATTTVHFYHSVDQFSSPDDVKIAEKDTSKNPFRVGSAEREHYWIRDQQQPGAHYYYAYVDSVPGERNMDNNYSNVVRVDVRGPDLVVNSVSVDYYSREQTVRPDGIFELEVTVRNQGTDDADDSTLHYYVSLDATLSNDDTKVATRRVFSLDPNETSTKIYRSDPIRTPYPSGIFYALVCVDPVELESDTTNNCYEPIKLTVKNYRPREVGQIDEQPLTVGTSTALDVSGYFEDTNQDILKYTADSSDPKIVTADVPDGSVTLTLTPHQSGRSTITVTASDGELTATQTFPVSVSSVDEPEPEPDTPAPADTSPEVLIPDANLRTVVRSTLGVEEGDTITQQKIQELNELNASIERLRDLTGLEYATNLRKLRLTNTQISDFTLLANLTSLTWLDISRNQISDITPLKNLTKLTWLVIENTQISDITPLKDLTNLTYLNLYGNQISDITPLKDLTKLTSLSLYNNYRINDIAPLKNLTKLTQLQLMNNRINDVKPLKDLTFLTTLWIHGNQIVDISSLAALTALTRLTLDQNQISDITVLANFTNLTDLGLRWNQITDVTPLENLTSLTRLQLYENPIEDLAPLRRLKENNPSVEIDIDINTDLDNAQGAPTAPMIPAETTLLSNYPNPFNPETWIPYQLAKAANVNLTIYDVRGIVVQQVALGHQPAGFYQNRSRAAYWDGRNGLGEPVAGGVYFYTLTAGDFTATRKMLILK